MPRAFALIIRSSNTAYIDDVTSYKIGESNSVSRGFGIYPARIVIDSAGAVSSYGNPIADTADPIPGAIDTNNVVLEFGSLYYGQPNAPPSSGTLCRLAINMFGNSSTTIFMNDEDTYRGGLVFEDGSQGNVTDSEAISALQPPGPATAPSHNGITGVSRAGVTLSWTAGTGTVDSRDVYFGTANPPPFVINQTATTRASGTMIQGQTYYWHIDEKNTAGTTTGALWSFTVEECLKTSDTGYSYWKFLGKPSCWCFRRQCRGDSTGSDTLGKPVAGNDFANFQSGFNIATTLLSGKKDTNSNMSICADYTHTVTLGKPVAGNDFSAFQAYFNKARTSVPECATTNINFLMN